MAASIPPGWQYNMHSEHKPLSRPKSTTNIAHRSLAQTHTYAVTIRP